MKCLLCDHELRAILTNIGPVFVSSVDHNGYCNENRTVTVIGDTFSEDRGLHQADLSAESVRRWLASA